MLLDGLRQVGQHNRQRCNNRIAVDFSHLLVLRQNPPGRNAVSRFHSFNTVNLTAGVGRLQSQIIIHQNFTGGHFLTANLDDILVGTQCRAIVKADGRNDKAHILCKLSAENHNTADQFAAAALIHQRNQAVAKFHLNGFHTEQGIDVVDIFEIIGLAGGLGLLGRCHSGCFLRRRHQLLLFHPSGTDKTAGAQSAAHQNQRNCRRAGNDCQENQDHTGGQNGTGLGLELMDNIGVEAAVRHGTCDNHTRSRGDHQGRNLRHQAIADGGNGVDADDGADVAAALNNADNGAGHKVDDRDNQGHDRVALDDLGGAVHGAVEVGFLLNLVTPLPGLFFINEAGTQVGVNGHLLTGHGVQGEAGRHFRDTLGAFGNDDKLHQNDDQEDQHTDDNIAAGNQGTEGLDDHTGLTAFGQNQSRRGYVQSQSE